jgi:hypothetical protein
MAIAFYVEAEAFPICMTKGMLFAFALLAMEI